MEQFTPEALEIHGIRQWDMIEKRFRPSSILLGNGFSINLSKTLRYKFLYETFISSCSDTSKELFNLFNTKNFERILGNIDIAKVVCQSFQIETHQFEGIHNEVREGLIRSIREIHPKPDDINQDILQSLGLQVKKFNQIFTTNYDLFLYYIILESNTFGDHFFNTSSNKYNYFNEPDQRKRHHIYYLHGALFLFEKGLTTLKIKKPHEGWLLDAVTDEIAQNNYPLFVSEGDSENKLKAIQSNSYLSFCLQNLENNEDENLVVFGQSLSEQDKHLVYIIDKHYENVLVSIRVDEYETIRELKAEKDRISGQFKHTTVDFFDAKTLFKF